MKVYYRNATRYQVRVYINNFYDEDPTWVGPGESRIFEIVPHWEGAMPYIKIMNDDRVLIKSF